MCPLPAAAPQRDSGIFEIPTNWMVLVKIIVLFNHILPKKLTAACKYGMIQAVSYLHEDQRRPAFSAGRPQMMEVTVTKRILLILVLLLLCASLAAWAEETGEETIPEAVAGESAFPVYEEESPQILPEDEFAAPAEEPAQDETAAGHTWEHPTREVQSGEAVYQSMHDPDMHRVIRSFDLYCDACRQVVEAQYRVEETAEPHAFVLVDSIAATCVREGSQTFACSLCGDQRTDILPITDHDWTEWEDSNESEGPACTRDQTLVHHCKICGLEETKTVPARGHQWAAVSYTEATCCEDGEAVRRCTDCGEEETIVLPAYGHTYVQSTSGDTQGQYVCAICGEVKEETASAQNTKTHMYYNNTVTSFGPTTRELIGGSVWNRVTPVDLSQEGVFTYPLVASNQYTVGTATLVNGEDSQQVNYRLSSPKINVHSESLVVYPNLQALKTGENAMSFDFNKPIDLKSCFGDEAHVIVAITLKADYDADSAGVRRFSADQKWIDQMMEMIK